MASLKKQRSSPNVPSFLKCSGEHPVCHRCTTRGLICQYSSREPRPRGPSKARLRNTVSSVDLHSSTTPNSLVAHGSHHVQHKPSQKEPFHSQECTENGYHRRVSSIPASGIPRSFYDSRAQTYSASISNPGTYEAFRTPTSEYDEHSYPDTLQVPHSHFGNQSQEWHDVRRVNSHPSLMGRGADKSLRYGGHSPFDFSIDLVGPASYGQVPSYKPPSSSVESAIPSFGPFSSGSHLVHHPQIRQPDMRSWGHRSDGGSSG